MQSWAEEVLLKIMTTNAMKPVTASAKTELKLPEESVKVTPINRREFLFYVWGASMALFTAQTTGVIIWFMLPRFKEGELGGTFTVPAPPLGSPPVSYPDGKFWLSHTDQGLVALVSVCTHLGCLYQWIGANDRFECPCHGSKFQAWGEYIEGPAPRSLDRYEITFAGAITNANGDPLQVGDASGDVQVNTGSKIQRAGKV